MFIAYNDIFSVLTDLSVNLSLIRSSWRLDHMRGHNRCELVETNASVKYQRQGAFSVAHKDDYFVCYRECIVFKNDANTHTYKGLAVQLQQMYWVIISHHFYNSFFISDALGCNILFKIHSVSGTLWLIFPVNVNSHIPVDDIFSIMAVIWPGHIVLCWPDLLWLLSDRFGQVN